MHCVCQTFENCREYVTRLRVVWAESKVPGSHTEAKHRRRIQILVCEFHILPGEAQTGLGLNGVPQV